LALTEDTSSEDSATVPEGEEEPPPTAEQTLTLWHTVPPDSETQHRFFQQQILRRQLNQALTHGQDCPEPETEPGL
jgi:hypothetical protein